LLGVAAAAPATDLATLMTDDLNSTGGRNLTAMTVWSWSRVYGAPVDGIVASSAVPTTDRLAEECIESPFDIFLRERASDHRAAHKRIPDHEKPESRSIDDAVTRVSSRVEFPNRNFNGTRAISPTPTVKSIRIGR
jgi:hypothetical protein